MSSSFSSSPWNVLSRYRSVSPRRGWVTGPLWTAVVVAGLLSASDPALAQPYRMPVAAEFPQDPAAWINSPPLSIDAISGKGVVLVFFEEDCPKCRSNWPHWKEVAAQQAGEPVLFIAVNSGCPRAEIEAYAKGVQLDWPIVVDPSRAYEKAMDKLIDFGEISLENITQMAVIHGTGEVERGSWKDLAGNIQLALQGAEWRYDPKDVPPALRPAWLAIEFGNYPAAAAQLKQHDREGVSKASRAADGLLHVVEEERDRRVKDFEAMLDSSKWQALQLAKAIQDRFKGYDLPESVTRALKTLPKDDEVKAGMAARKQLEGFRRTLGSGQKAKPKVLDQLRQIAEKFPNSDLATEAERLLEAAEGKPSGKDRS